MPNADKMPALNYLIFAKWQRPDVELDLFDTRTESALVFNDVFYATAEECG